MLTIREEQFDQMLVCDRKKLAEALADTSFARHGYYAPMPRDVRVLLASVAVAEARKHGMDTAQAIAGFVQAMVDMSPRFAEMAPFADLLVDSSVEPDRKIARLQSPEMAAAWDNVLADLQNNEDWHIDYWDEHIDWEKQEILI